MSAFDYTKDELGSNRGEVANWIPQQKAEIAKQLRHAYRIGFQTNPSGSIGLLMLSLYLEAQTLLGEKAKRLVTDIGEWHRKAVLRDIERKSST